MIEKYNEEIEILGLYKNEKNALQRIKKEEETGGLDLVLGYLQFYYQKMELLDYN